MEETVVPFVSPLDQLAPTTAIRGSLLLSSMQSLREHGLGDRYLELLPDEHRVALTTLVAGVWVPIEIGRVHYETCDRLGLGAHELNEIGADVSRRVQGSLLSMLLKAAGVSLWTGLGQSRRLYERVFVGGGIEVVQLGPKDAGVTFGGFTLATIAYVRAGLRSILKASGEAFARTVVVKEMGWGSAQVSYRVSWA